jgi:hypothetical protein
MQGSFRKSNVDPLLADAFYAALVVRRITDDDIERMWEIHGQRVARANERSLHVGPIQAKKRGRVLSVDIDAIHHGAEDVLKSLASIGNGVLESLEQA